MVYNVNFWEFAFEPPGPHSSASTQEKIDWNKQSVDEVNLNNYPDNHEVLGTVFYLQGPFVNTSPIELLWTVFNDDTNERILSGWLDIPTPQSQGKDFWDWIRTIPYATHNNEQISGPMRVRMECSVSGGGLPSFSETLYMDVVAPPSIVPTIKGTVTDDETGNPLQAALVSFPGADSFTNAHGFYSLNNFDLMSAPLTCIKSGYSEESIMVTAPSEGTITQNFSLVPIPPITEETPQFWVNRGYNQEQAEFIANWVTENQMTPTTEFIDLLLSTQGLIPLTQTLPWTQRLINWMDETSDNRWFDFVERLFGLEQSYVGTEGIPIVGSAVPLIPGAGAIPLTASYLDDAASAIHPSILAKLTPVRRSLWSAVTSKAKDILPAKRLFWWLAAIAGADTMFVWLAEDNIAESTEFRSTEIIRMLRKGEITKEEALEMFDSYQGFIDKSKTFLNISTWANPLLWLFRGIIMDGITQAEMVFNDNRAIVEAWEPEEPEEPEEPVNLNITSTPTQAKIYVDDVYTYELTNTAIIVNAGTRSITLKKTGYEDQTKSITLEPETSNSIHFDLIEVTEPPPPPPEEGTLILAVTPEDSTISIAGQTQITSPGTYNLPQGSYSIRAEKEGFTTIDRTFYINENETTNVSIILEEEVEEPPEPRPAKVVIDSEPHGADVYINGQYKFVETPYTIYLDAGAYTIRVQKEGYYPSEIEAEFEEGESVIIPFILVPIPDDDAPTDYPPPGVIWPPYVAPPSTDVPPFVVMPPSQQPKLNYPYLLPPLLELPPTPSVTAPTQKELLVNIETTDVLPWKGRIFSIAMLDLTDPAAEIIVLTDINEERLVFTFLEFFENKNYTRFTGFKTIFDYRWIFAKLLLYRLRSKKYSETKLKDIKQLLDQVKEEFVYFPDKRGTLDDWGKLLLGKGKMGSQETLLREFLSGNFDYVKAFQTRQIELERDLYTLVRFSSGESFVQSYSPTSTSTSSPQAPVITGSDQGNQVKKCPVCLQENPINATECSVCQSKL